MATFIYNQFPYLYILLNGKQYYFHNMHSFINLFCGGNKTGKTAGGATKLLLAMKERPIRARVASDPELVEKVVVPEIIKWLGEEADAWTIQKKGKRYESWFVAPNGSICDVLSYEQKPKEFEGVALDYLWLDEPPPYAIWGACTSRFLKAGRGEINMTMTPLRGAAWVNDELVEKADWILGDRFTRESWDKKWGWSQEWRKTHGRRISVLFVDIEDNCQEHGVRGLIPHEKIEQIISAYDEEEKDARAHGKFLVLTGKVYKELKPHHLIDPIDIPENAILYHINDPHDRKYPALT